MPHTDFVHLHNHTEYSMLDGACRLSDLVDIAHESGMPAVAITDHRNMFGAMEFYMAARGKGIKPIVGCEVNVSPSSRFSRDPKEASYHLVLLAKNDVGYRNLMELVSRGYTEGFYYRARVDKELLEEYHEGLMALSACIQGQVPALILAGQTKQARQIAGELRDIYGQENFYLELQYHELADEKRAMPELIKIAKSLEIPVVVTNDCHYIRHEDAEAHEALLAIQTGKTIDDPTGIKFGSDVFHFRSLEEMQSLFSDYPEAMANSLRIAEKCNLELPFGGEVEVVIPDYEVPDGYGPDSYIEHLAREGLKKLYPQNDREVEDRLQYELGLIEKTGFAPFFLMARDIVLFAHSKGISVGPGRGSAAGSVVSYGMGITNIDPLKYGLVFERFLNPERITPPDFDLDFDSLRRGEIVDYMIERFGRESVAQIIAFHRMTSKQVIQDVGRVLGMTPEEARAISNLIPSIQNKPMSLDKAIETVPELQQIAQDPENKRLMSIARTLENVARNASVHAAGVVVTSGKLTQYVPLYKTSKNEIVVQYDKQILEEIGVNKLDILGIAGLPMIDCALKLIEENHHVKVDLNNIPMDDEATYDLICTGRTLGLWQLGGQGYVDLVLKLQPRMFEDLVPLVSLYRPGPIQSGMKDEYVGRKLGTIPIKYAHPVLEPVLKDTYGTIVYQEQVMKIGREMAGFTLGQTDVLRRAMGKKLVDKIEKQRGPFLDGARAKGIDPKIANDVFESMIPFAGYCFNQSHSTAYALITYQTAYLKVHYPLEFMAAGMTNAMKRNDSSASTAEIIKYVKECQKQDMEVLPPDVNESYNEFVIRGGSIRFGLGAIKNVGESAVESIVAAREAGEPFKSIFDFCERVDPKAANRKCIESLIKCGAFDTLDGHRAQFLAALDTAIEAGQSAQRDKAVGQASLFDFSDSFSADIRKLPNVPKASNSEILAMEKEILGFYISGHPLSRCEQLIKEYTNASSSTFEDIEDGEPITIGGMIASIRNHTTKNDKQMAFVTLEDLEGTVDLVVFSEALESCSDAIQEGNIVWVKGHTGNGQRARENISILVDEMLSLDDARQKFSTSVHVRLPLTMLEASALESLKGVFADNKGGCNLFLHFRTSQYDEVVIQANPDTKVSPTEALISQVEKMVGEQCVWLGNSH